MNKKIISLILSVMMILALLPFVPQLATEVRADDPVYEDITYVDEDGNTQTENCRILTSSDEYIYCEQGQTEAWWAVTGDVTINSNDLLVGGKVNLILCDNATLHVKVVDIIDDPTTFNIWCQENGTGKIVTNDTQGVCVWGSLVLNGGYITQNEYEGSCCVIIYDSGTFTMNGGTVESEDGYGVNIPHSGTFIMNGGTVIGYNGAILGPVINNSPGTGWEDTLGGGNSDAIEVSTTARELSYREVQIIRANYEIKASADPQAGGSVTGAGTYKAGQTVTLKATPSSEHYSFVNWTENGEVVKDEKNDPVGKDYSFIASSDRDLVANFQPDRLYTVKFVNENGTQLQSSELLPGVTPEYTGKTPTKEADAQYTYAFNNWIPEITAAVEDATYTAEYTATVNKYDLTFDLNGGTLNGQTGKITMTYEYGAKIKLPDAPTKEDYKFLYWKGSQYEAGAEYTVDGPHDFTAVWEKVETSPKTGDNNQIIIWHALLGGAIIAGISILIVALKKKQQ